LRFICAVRAWADCRAAARQVTQLEIVDQLLFVSLPATGRRAPSMALRKD
jgi:hypothetical protein